ncbi:DUF551 domain-containing protein [Klebsiella pneumoniae]|uniref:DUF551 domain-containing protein n=1 Tax=Klebsiella pneumoniae TaxID=573 RepID=UPI000A171A77|nr:DUF551 domain-containing protein [Klebsiella pneumoniae]
MTKSTITREWLQHQISAIEAVGITDSNTLAAFKLALAAMDSEPVAWISQSNLDALSRGHDALVKSTDNVVQPVPLYRHAQQPVVPDRWIPVSERLPDEGGRYLAWVQQQNDLGLSQWADNVGYQPDSLGFRVTGRVTHWMPLPAPPKGVKGE